jgi:AcrR family transcriptional regulator
MELYAERGYERTTVADIAQRAGLTARTFFRHFADKREVVFGGSELLAARLAEELAAAPSGTGPLGAVAAALGAVAGIIGEDREHSRRRQAVIAANAELRERELIKLAGWSQLLAEGLRKRGVEEPAASLAAQAGVAAFAVAFERWLEDPDDGATLRDAVRDALGELRALAAAG